MSTAALAPEKPLRLACNRCHAQKLRCPRSSEADRNGPDEPCSRCRKAGAECIVSKRGKVGRPAKRKPNSPASVEEAPKQHHHHHRRHGQNSENASSDGSLMHVFGLAPDMLLQQGQLTPPDTEDQRLCDAENLLSSTGSPSMTPTPQLSLNDTSTHCEDNSEVDPALWPSQHPWPSGAFNAEPNCFSASESTLYEPLLQDLNLDLELPTFNFAPESTEMFDLAGSMPVINNKDGDGILHMFHGEPQRKTEEAYKSLNVPHGSTEQVSRTTSVLKLSDLSAKIIRSSEKYRNGPVHTPVEAGALLGQQIMKDIVDFSGELIDIARQGLPRFISQPQPSIESSASSDVDISAADEDDGPSESTMGSVDSYMTSGSVIPAPCIPESAVIFLLLGCYTQLLHSFELAIDCLYAEHRNSTDGSDDSPGTVNSLLKASLLIHTVTYLLGRVHRSFAVGETESTDGGSKHGEDAHSVDMQGWKRSLLGDENIDEGLLGRAFSEIQEREQGLMKKAKHLRQMINAFQI
ncbi:hypothetical protein QQZ08_002983 [Neonectria magnoliae]|uniref:Zn(2)-C6 fungal-type domain-containing protein n=1 Tax=Neonectria magnoliae TaxID=2732573 RepID=A0ABR1IA31_9HYPO